MAALRPMSTGLCPPTVRRAALDRRKSITFKGKSFYLDLPQNKHTKVLTKAICRLGGVIEGFLSRDINYVVTGNKKALELSYGSLVAGKRGLHCKRQAAENIEPAMSRGKQLLKKAIKNQEHNSVLANAHSWGVCVLHVDEILEYLQRSTHSAPKAAEGKAAIAMGQTVKVGKLKGPFLKIEDQSRKYRPLQCCFSSFPEISFISSDRSPFETARTNNSTHKEKDAGDQEEDDGERSQRPNARKKSGYCECCQVTYTKLSEHLFSEQHRQFALDTSNYKVIDDIACHITCDVMEYPHGMPVSEGGVEVPVSVEDAQGSVVKEESKMCEENGALPTKEEDHTEPNVGEEHLLGVACRLPVENVATGKQEENMDVTLDDGEPVEDKGQRHPFAEDPNHDLMQCKKPLKEICDTGATSHVDVVTEVSWYTEAAGLTSVYTVQSLVIPPDSQHAQLNMANALATFAPPLLLSPLADSQGALGIERPSEAHNAIVLGNSLPGTQITNTTGDHCSELLVEQTSLLAIGEQHQELFAEPSTVSFCGVQLLDALGQLPAGEKRSEEMLDIQMGSIRVHEQEVLSGGQNQPLLNSPTGLHTQVTRALSQDQLNVFPLYEDPRDTLVVNSSSTHLTDNPDREDQSQLNITLLAQGLANTSAGTHGGTTPIGDQASEPKQNQLNVLPLCQGLYDNAEMAHSTTPLGNKVGAPQQNPLNAIPLYQGPAMTQSSTTLPNKAGTQEQIKMQSTTDFCRGKHKHSFSSSPPPAKRQPYQYQPLSLPAWMFQQLSDSGLQPAAAHGCPDVKEKGSVTNEGNVDSPSPYFSPKLLQYDASSESDWDLGLLSQQQCKHQQGAQLGDLRTAQVNLEESWYGKELCSVLVQDQNLGSLSTPQTVTLAHTSYDLYLSRAAS